MNFGLFCSFIFCSCQVRLAPLHPEQQAELRLERTLVELGRLPKTLLPSLLHYPKKGTGGRPSWPKDIRHLPTRYPRYCSLHKSLV